MHPVPSKQGSLPQRTASAEPVSFGDMSPRGQGYVGAIVLAGAALLSLRLPPLTIAHPPLLASMLVAAIAASSLRVALPGAGASAPVSATMAALFASLLLIGPDATLIAAAAAGFTQCTFGTTRRNPVYWTAFSMSALVTVAFAAGRVYAITGGVPLADASSFDSLELPIIVSALVWVFLSALVMGGGLLATSGWRATTARRDELSWITLSGCVGTGAGAVAAVLVHGTTWWLWPAALLPLVLTHVARRLSVERIEAEQRRTQQMSDLHFASIEALAVAIDAKDMTPTTHVRRVQAYAGELAVMLGMSDCDVQAVRTAAVLHDIGKLAVPEHILSKPGPLTPEEFQKIRTHPQIGAEIVGAVPFPYPVAPFILAHHERWDGRGYPSGLKGEQIPLGARILSVVDQFDALTTERPYKSACSTDEAFQSLRREAGRSLDPHIVDLFIDAYPRLSGDAERLAEAAARQLSFASVGPFDNATRDGSATVFRDIALAHREVYALYELAQALGTSLGIGDTMALIASKLHNLVPFASCALFLHTPETDTLRCRFATGVDAELLQQLTVANGEGLVGWAAKNERALVNARPSTDFDAAGIRVHTSLHSALVIPLVFNTGLVGALAVYGQEAGCFTDDHRRLLARVAEQAAGVIANSITYEETKRDSLTDPLTGLPNTRFMFVHLTRELARAERLKSEVSLLVMDLDSFKEINDNFGHAAGDRALREVARVLRAGIRPYDICVRYAGDEFVVLLSGCGPDEAQLKMLELQAAIDALMLEVRPGRLVRLGASFGSASFPTDGHGYETLLSVADERMYDDKARRKDPASDHAAGVHSAETSGRPSVFAKIDRPAGSRMH